MTANCESCFNLDPHDEVHGKMWTSGPVFEHTYMPLLNIMENERLGCKYCSLLARIVDEFVPDWQPKADAISLHVIAPDDRPMEVRIMEAPDPDTELLTLANINVSAPQGMGIPGFAKLGCTRAVAQSAADPECFKFIQERLEICRSHIGCTKPMEKSLPKRVIKLGSQNEDISLYETFHEFGIYAALSYCWGKSSNLLMTTQATLETFKKCVPWEKLPRTLQDAIIITRGLGIKYIWIDCLCIIQYSHTDWEIEAAKMGQYYRDAFITIGASSSSNSQSGILVNRPAISLPKKVQLSKSEGEGHYIIAQSRDSKLWPSPIWQLGPLAERAWTFQEHALSARMIHFTSSEVIWECRSEMLSEDGNPIRNHSRGLIQDFDQEMKQDPERSWRLFVRAYSERSLTFLDDKLPAIAGIAASFQQQTGFQYLAGLWRETLAVDLVWVSWGWEECDAPPRTVQGPSWSWASIHGGVAFEMETISDSVAIETHCVIENAACNTPGQNPFGLVTEGILEVTGPLLEVELAFNERFDDFGIPIFELTLGDDVSAQLFFPDTSLESVEVEDDDGVKYWTVQRTTKPPVPFKATVWCLWCFTALQEPSEMQILLETEVMRLHGVVLAKSGVSPHIFHRIGAVAATDDSVLLMAAAQKITVK